MNSRVTWFLSALLGAIALSPQSVFANDSITPEMNGSTTVQFNDGMYRIENGNISGNNLFHSFEEFGLKPGETADFNITGLNIMNIVGRVVGGNVSVIDGLLQVSGGNANLFLMNSAGIIFGTGASINVPGDFTATTATAIGFGDDRWFNAYGPNDYTNLTGNPSEFAFDLANPQGIINLGNLSNINGGDLTLLAGTIVSQGNLAAPNGNLIVASVPGSSLIRISQPGYLLSLEIERPRDANGLMQEIPITALPALLTGDLDNLFDRAENLEGIPIAARGLVASGDIWGEKGTADGNILVSAHGHLTLNDRWSTATQWEDAGNITLLARGNIEVEDLTASSSGEGNGGAIALFSQWGRISTQNIETTAERGFGGDVSIAAEGSIATENIITSSSLGESGGAIWLFSADGSINTEVLDSSAD
ncbi:MAG: filamentous hemagglutinin N-terminal domain-containing protein, partial [Spirulina sp.]